MYLPEHVVTKMEFDRMPVEPSGNVYQTRQEGVRFRYSTGQWGCFVNGVEHLLVTRDEVDRRAAAFSRSGRRCHLPAIPMTKNQRKRRSQKMRGKR